MLILAIETSSTIGSIGLSAGENNHVRILSDQTKHSEVILNEINSLFDAQQCSLDDLTAIAFAHGPGSFTGLRIACSIVQAISFAKDIRVITINTLEAIAQQTYETNQTDKVVAVMDARMGEIFIAAYQKIGCQWQAVMAPTLTKVSDLYMSSLHDTESWTVAGTGDVIRQVANYYQIACHDDVLLTADAVLSLAKQRYDKQEFINAEDAQPFYLRNKVALTMAEQRMR